MVWVPQELTSQPKHVESLKFVAYQMGQTSALLTGAELFDKDAITSRYPALKSAIDRSDDIALLELVYRWASELAAHHPDGGDPLSMKEFVQ